MMHSSCCTKQILARGIRRASYGALFLLCLLFTTAASYAQSTFGSFTGVIKDPSGAIVVNAEVTLTNVDTGVKKVEHTNKSGEYTFPNIDTGNYTIDVLLTGFEKLEFPGLTLQALETQRVDGSLKLGSESTVVSVTSTTAGVVNTDDQNISEVRTSNELVNLPIMIGTIQGGSTSALSAALGTQAGVQGTNIAGASASQATISVDGITTMNVEASGFATDMIPSVNSIEEVKINENANAAEFGGLASIITTSKGGKNRPAGGIFENYASKNFNANSPANATKPNLVVHDFGAFFGGPVIVPHLYDGHNKTFYFASYEGLRKPQTSIDIDTVPTQAELNGDFSQFLSTNPIGPLANASQQLYHSDGVTPWVNNQIPTSQWNPVASKVLALYYPLPNYTGPSYSASGGVVANNYEAVVQNPITSNQGDLRLDQTFTSKQSAYVRYSYKQIQTEVVEDSGMPLAGAASPIYGYDTQKNTSLAGSYNYIFTPNVLNEFRSGVGKYITATTFTNQTNSTVLTSLGIQGIPQPLPAGQPTIPSFSITGLTSTGANIAGNSSNSYEFIDNLTFIHGKHTFKMGMDYTRSYAFNSNVFASSRDGSYKFATSNAPATGILLGPSASRTAKEKALSGSELAELVEGVPDSTGLAQVTLPNQNGRGNSWAWYFQDDFKVFPSLTVSYGLRYEYHPPLTDKYDNTADFDPSYFGTNGQGANAYGAFYVPHAADLYNGLNVAPAFRTAVTQAGLGIFAASQLGIPYGLMFPSRDDFGPRLGFAWRPLHNDKTVLRGGIGEFYQGVLGTEINAGWATSASLTSTYNNSYSPGTTTPVLTQQNPFPASAAKAALISYDYGANVHFKDAPVTEWNLTMEQDIGYKTDVRLSYVGNHMADLPDTNSNINLDPYQPLAGASTPTPGLTYPTQTSLPFPSLGETTYVQNVGIQNYNSIVVEVTHRLSKGLQFNSSYTYLRNLQNYIADVTNPQAFYGNVAANHRHRWISSAVYNLPFGRNQMFMGNTSYLMNQVVGNWSLSGFWTAEDGDFLTPTVSAGTSGDPTGSGANFYGGDAIYPNVVPGANPYAGVGCNGGPVGAKNHLQNVTYSSTCTPTAVNAFSDVMALASSPIPGVNGNARPASILGNGTNSLNISLSKGIAFTERIKFAGAIQAANVLNRKDFSDPPVNIDSPTLYGISTSYQTLRQMLITARLTF